MMLHLNIREILNRQDRDYGIAPPCLLVSAASSRIERKMLASRDARRYVANRTA
jgi:hypothetical protein